MSSFLRRKESVPNFRQISQKLKDLFTYKQTDRQMETVKLIQIFMLISFIYTLEGLRRFILDVTNFVANLKYPVLGIKSINKRQARNVKEQKQ